VRGKRSLARCNVIDAAAHAILGRVAANQLVARDGSSSGHGAGRSERKPDAGILGACRHPDHRRDRPARPQDRSTRDRTTFEDRVAYRRRCSWSSNAKSARHCTSSPRAATAGITCRVRITSAIIFKHRTFGVCTRECSASHCRQRTWLKGHARPSRRRGPA
jgi:hypothetical protein